MNTNQLLIKLTKAISYQYRDDVTAPSLIISALKRDYYCSVVRYRGSFAADKVVICKYKSNTLRAALLGLIEKFLDQVDPIENPIHDLRSHVALELGL